ncbi:MAG: DUF3299 domain-containing protein [Alphaproteobacteria bacterium]|nr:DUF3299 domain-containing protein [Alphaproteobacteria bacterium]
MIRTAFSVLLILALWNGLAQAADSVPEAAPSLDNPWATGGYNPIPLPEVEGALPWETLHQVELVFEGPDLIPEFADEVQQLSGERIKMVGFMLPLDASGERILLSQFAPHCPFCMTAGPESFVELQTEEPFGMSLDPIVVEGTLEVLDQNIAGYYYRMADVTLVAYTN